ncbi:hypothetical protein ACI784_09325 [Geodermatophilus sp. SYSU D01186]
MATALRHLLDDLAERTGAPAQTATIEDVTGALAHLGRALTGLADDGLTPTASARQTTATELAAACATAGRLWPRTGGPLTDLGGVAADLIGRERASMGRAHRWAVTVELAEVADHCAHLGRRLLPRSAAPELAFVRMIAAAVERDAQADPPTAEGTAVLDCLVPLPGPPSGATAGTALDASAALVAALDRALQADDLTLRDFRAAVAAAELTSRYAAISTGRAGEDAGPLMLTGLAWQLAGRASMVFHDGHRAEPGDRRGVVAWSQTLVSALSSEVHAHADAAGRRDRRELADVAAAVHRVAGELPVLADRLSAAVDRWSRTGRLYANARDLPPMENMPEERVSAVIAGQQVRASGADLDRLRVAVGRAVDLSIGLTHVLACAASPAATSQRPLPSAPGRLLDRAHAVALSLAAVRFGPDAARGVLPAPPDV